MALTERQKNIMKVLKERKNVNVKELSSFLYVSEATIRRDFAEMQKMGLLERSHGGAILSDNADEVSIFFRMQKNATEKEKLATIAMPHIPQFRSVFIDSSSTALALAERLDLSFKTVVTNNLQASLQLSKKKDINILLLGGSVQYNNNSTTGSFTTKQLDEFTFDLMLTSCAGVKNSESLERSLEQKHIKRKAFERSDKKILLVDHTKFSSPATFKVASLKEYDMVIADYIPDSYKVESDINFIYN